MQEKLLRPVFSLSRRGTISNPPSHPVRHIGRESLVELAEAVRDDEPIVNRCIIVVQRSRTKKSKLKAPKVGLRNGVVKKRVFSLSPSLSEQLRPFVEGRRVAGELGALLDKGFLAQDLPKFSPNAETAS
jgi:hypothetical protein